MQATLPDHFRRNSFWQNNEGSQLTPFLFLLKQESQTLNRIF
jgi:hypothetical protein